MSQDKGKAPSGIGESVSGSDVRTAALVVGLGLVGLVFWYAGGSSLFQRAQGPQRTVSTALSAMNPGSVRSMCQPALEDAAGADLPALNDAPAPIWDDTEWAWTGDIALPSGEPGWYSCVVYGNDASDAKVASARVGSK